MIRMFVRHSIADYAAWKSHYDDFDAARKELGVRAGAFFRGAPDASEVTVWHDFDTLDAAQAFVDAPQLAAVMQAAGVVGQPQIWFTERDLPA